MPRLLSDHTAGPAHLYRRCIANCTTNGYPGLPQPCCTSTTARHAGEAMAAGATKQGGHACRHISRRRQPCARGACGALVWLANINQPSTSEYAFCSCTTRLVDGYRGRTIETQVPVTPVPERSKHGWLTNFMIGKMATSGSFVRLAAIPLMRDTPCVRTITTIGVEASDASTERLDSVVHVLS